jgi:hypothetical protein
MPFFAGGGALSSAISSIQARVRVRRRLRACVLVGALVLGVVGALHEMEVGPFAATTTAGFGGRALAAETATGE